MNRRTGERCLIDFGLKVEAGRGGDARIVDENGALIYAKYARRKKEIAPGTWAAIRRHAAGRGVQLPTYKDTKSGEYEAPAVVVTAPEPEKEEDYSEDGTFVTYAYLSDLSDIDQDWLEENLPGALPKEAFWDDHVDEESFLKWHKKEDIVPLRATIEEMGGTKNMASSWVQGGKIATIPGRYKKRRRWLARKADIEQLFYGPRTARNKRGIYEPVPDDEKGFEAPIGLKGPLPSRVTIRKITPEMAKKFLDLHNKFAGQRKLDYSHFKELCRKIELGLFHPGTIAFAVFPGGGKVLIDGQHYLSVLVTTNTIMSTTVVEISVRDNKEAQIAFEQFNNRRSTKGFNVMVSGVWETFKPPCHKGNANMIAKALTHYKRTLDQSTGEYRGHKWQTIYDDEKAHILADENEWDVVKFLDKLLEKSSVKRMKKLSIYVSAVWHFRVNQRDARLFWTPIITGIGGYEDENDPRKMLGDWLQTMVITQHRGGEDKATEEEIFNTIQMYWNHFRRGRTTSRVRRVKKPTLAV